MSATPGVSIPGRHIEDNTAVVALAIDGRTGASDNVTNSLTANGNTSRTADQRTGTIYVEGLRARAAPVQRRRRPRPRKGGAGSATGTPRLSRRLCMISST